MTHPVERRWSWDLAPPPAALWPLIVDTGRFNEAAGFPRYTLEERPLPDGSVERLGHARVGPLKVTWEEMPFDFVEGAWLRQRRRFLSGPVREMTARIALEPQGA